MRRRCLTQELQLIAQVGAVRLCAACNAVGWVGLDSELVGMCSVRGSWLHVCRGRLWSVLGSMVQAAGVAGCSGWRRCT